MHRAWAADLAQQIEAFALPAASQEIVHRLLPERRGAEVVYRTAKIRVTILRALIDCVVFMRDLPADQNGSNLWHNSRHRLPFNSQHVSGQQFTWVPVSSRLVCRKEKEHEGS